MDIRFPLHLAPRAWRFAASILIALSLLACANAARAQTWTLQTVLDPPLLPDVDPKDNMGFGAAVSVGSVSWLVVGAPLADCPNPIGFGTVADAGRIFIYRRVNGVWQHHQSFCSSSPVYNARYGAAVDVSESWMIVGEPGYSQNKQAAVEMLHFDSQTQLWSREMRTVGDIGGYLGRSVAIDRGLAVAGEPGYDALRGRMRSWKLSGATITAQPHYAPPGLTSNDRFGSKVAVQSNGCELPLCTSFTDVAAAFGGETLYVVKRAIGGWQASQAISPPSGAHFQPYGGLDVSHYQVVAAMYVDSQSAQIGCPMGPAVRVYFRNGGAFQGIGDACQPPSDELYSFGSVVAADRGTTTFYVASPDNYVIGNSLLTDPASVATFAGYPTISYIDSVPELSLAPAQSPMGPFNDAFGASISSYSSYLAVGAPWHQLYLGVPGRGYVVVYRSCC